MGLFKKLFGEKPEKQKVFYASPDELMNKAYEQARGSFKYLWRELYWEYRRIVPAHSFAMVKVPFKEITNGEEMVEHMWINNIEFNGETIKGELVNDPNHLTNVAKGHQTEIPISEISDWMLSIGGKTYGGFTVHAMRSQMSDGERQDHDNAWGLNFGDFNQIEVVHKQLENPDNLIEHPMCVNSIPQVEKFFSNNPDEMKKLDANGNSMLHYEAIAGNSKIIEVLLNKGVDTSVRNKLGKTALDYGKEMGWERVVELFESR